MTHIQTISAVTFTVTDMTRSVRFYRALGFDVIRGGEGSGFTSFRVADGYVNLLESPGPASWRGWGRIIFYVDDVDAMYALARAEGITPEMAPSDAPWGERYFHVLDPDGHELSFARRLAELPITERSPRP
jgi:catechol 2,3-dioxygenase-like lactoylglutathione lyase family enzyme